VERAAGAFRATLEARLQARARDKKTDLQRLRRQVAFDRLLARLFSKEFLVEGRDWLAFGGIEAPSFPVISAEQQFAEKLHAYSLLRGERTNTRSKDLIDMALLIRQEMLDKSRVKLALGATFARRATHDVPEKLEPPPEEWAPVFAALARECSLDVSLSDGFATVRGFVAEIREP
jgi:predicted nucleotidyltransferase component of viral defense system